MEDSTLNAGCLQRLEKRRAKWRRWASKNPEYNRERTKVWRRSDPDKTRLRDRLSHLKHRTKRLAFNKQWAIKNKEHRRQFICYYCNDQYSSDRLHIDHVIPVSKGGKHSSDNICKSCDSCNLKKRNKDNSELSFLDQRLFSV